MIKIKISEEKVFLLTIAGIIVWLFTTLLLAISMKPSFSELFLILFTSVLAFITLSLIIHALFIED